MGILHIPAYTLHYTTGCHIQSSQFMRSTEQLPYGAPGLAPPLRMAMWSLTGDFTNTLHVSGGRRHRSTGRTCKLHTERPCRRTILLWGDGVLNWASGYIVSGNSKLQVSTIWDNRHCLSCSYPGKLIWSLPTVALFTWFGSDELLPLSFMKKELSGHLFDSDDDVVAAAKQFVEL